MNLGTVRVKESDDSYVVVLYVKVGQETYKSIYLDTQSGHVMEGICSARVAGKYPVAWEPK